MRTRWRWWGQLLLALAIGWAAPVSAAPYAPHDLGTLGGPGSVALDINGVGVVVGHSAVSSDGSISHAALWFNGRVTDLGTLGGSSSFAAGVSNNGLVTGWSFTTGMGGLYHHAFLWQSGAMRDLGALGTGQFSAGYAVNNAAQVVGASAYTSGSSDAHPFVWQNGTMVDLAPTAARGSAEDINNAGQIVGYASPIGNPGRYHAMLWQNGQAIDLGVTFPVRSYALGINELGQVVGYVEDGPRRAVTWINGVMHYLPQWQSGGDSIAYGINNAGQIVGVHFSPSSIAHAVLWQGDRIVYLGTLGGRTGTAQAINGSGVIVGVSTVVRTNNTNEPGHATLWSR